MAAQPSTAIWAFAAPKARVAFRAPLGVGPGNAQTGDMTRLFLRLFAALFIASGAASARADDAPKGLETFELSGTVGAYPVGASLTVRDYAHVVTGHYFYTRRLTNIPLTSGASEPDVELTEPGGAVFLLHFVSNGSANGQALNFYNSTGLAGTWTNSGKTLPVTFRFESSLHGPEPTRRYAEVTNASDAAFEAMAGRFLKAVLAGDKAAAVREVAYPLRVNGAHRLTIRSPAMLTAHWEQVFTPALLAQLRDAIPHEMFVHDGQAMVANGLVWFGDKGAVAISQP